MHFSGTLGSLLLVLVSLLLRTVHGQAAAVSATDWLQWRGNNRDATISGTNWPAGLAPERLTKLWRKELGPSYSGPVVCGNRVFVTATLNQQTEHVHALDLSSGEQLWESSWTGSMKVAWIGSAGGSWIRSTPASDGQSLFVLGMREVLVALDAATGRENWRVDFPQQCGSPVPDFGGVSSPLVRGAHLYIQAASGLAKLDKATGKVLWRLVDEGGGKSRNGAFASVTLATLNGRSQLLMQGREVLAGIDPETGTVLWKTPVPTMFGMNIVTPTATSNQVFTSTLGGTFLFEIGTNQPPSVTQQWRSKIVGEMSSPVLIDNHLYTHPRNGALTCLELASGRTRWSAQATSQYCSLVAQGQRILALTDRGVLRLIAANPLQYELLGEVRVSQNPTWAHLAVSGDLILIRDLEGLTVYRWQ